MEKYKVPHYRCKLVRDGASFYPLKTMRGAIDAELVARKRLKDRDREEFITIYLNNSNEIVGSETIAIGNSRECAIIPADVFRGAIVNGANAVVLAHCHPSGNSTPSKDDIEVTKNIITIGKLIGINVLDHIVVGCRNGFTESIASIRPEIFNN